MHKIPSLITDNIPCMSEHLTINADLSESANTRRIQNNGPLAPQIIGNKIKTSVGSKKIATNQID